MAEPLLEPGSPTPITGPSADSKAVPARQPTPVGLFFKCYGSMLARILWWGVLVFAFCLVWIAGHRGLYFQDQSMIFDGAWRIYCGQVPYRDLIMPFGPVAFLVQWVFFKIFGVNYSATVLSAAVLNVLATVIVLRLAGLFTGSKWLSLGAGTLTAALFQAPFGTLWLEQTGFFFDLVSLWLIVEGARYERHSSRLHFTAGVALAFAALAKQNAGTYFLPVVGLVLVFLGWHSVTSQPLRRVLVNAGVFTTGFGAALGLFLLWVVLFSDWPTFYRHAVEIPWELGRMRVDAVTPGRIFFLQARQPYKTACLIGLAGLLGCCLVQLLSARTCRDVPWRSSQLNALLAVLLTVFQRVFIATTLNDPENAVGFAGLTVATGCAGAWATVSVVFRDRLGTFVNRVVSAGVALIVIAGSVLGVHWSMNRIVQEFVGAKFEQRVNIPPASRLYWGDPTVPGVRRTDFEDVFRYLTERSGSFFVFPDASILYGLTGKVPPQPFLYFQGDHIFRAADMVRVDRLVLDGLQKNDVRTFVYEDPTLHGFQRILDDLPATRGWLNHNFVQVRNFGIFHIYERR